MKRSLIIIMGFLLAGVYATVMYALYGNLNWGSTAHRSVPWFEPVFWLIASSGVLGLAVHDLYRGLKRWLHTDGKVACCRSK